MPATSTQRILLLLQQHRPQEAEQEARRLLQDDPEDVQAHAFLAVSLLEQKRPAEAQAAAEGAIALYPEYDYAYHLLSMAHLAQGHTAEALSAIEEALALDPEDANYHHALGQLRFYQGQVRAALRAAEAGLAADASHVECLNLRARCLARLGQRDDAEANFAESLRQNPSDTGTHADLGWVALERGRAKQATEHFREALRLNPTSEYAREGLVASLKARFWVYNWFYRFVVWTQTLSPGARNGLFIGMFVLSRFVPGLLPLYLVFVYLSWFAEPIFNSLLRLNRAGRYALSAEDTRNSNQFLALLLSALLSLGIGTYLHLEALKVLGMVGLGLLFPLVGTQRLQWPQQRKRSMWAGVALAVLGVGAAIFTGLGHEFGGMLFTGFLFGSLAYVWAYALHR
jgi:tetratricopeptide (TPR) repeat protein